MIGLMAAILAAPAAPVAVPAATTQAIFDAASSAVDKGDCAEALRQFGLLDGRAASRRPAVAAVVALRRGRCLVHVARLDEGQAALDTGLATIGDAPVYLADRVLALVARGEIAFHRFDYAAAARDFTAARTLAPPTERL